MNSRLVLFLPALLFFNISCEQTTLPESTFNTISYKEIPPYSESTYFLYGYEKSEKTIIEQLKSKGFLLNDTWIPDKTSVGPCGMLIINQMIIRLQSPNPNIYTFGFVSDSSQAVPGKCLPLWIHYTFNN